jgi:hypothetical protein
MGLWVGEMRKRERDFISHQVATYHILSSDVLTDLSVELEDE